MSAAAFMQHRCIGLEGRGQHAVHATQMTCDEAQNLTMKIAVVHELMSGQKKTSDPKQEACNTEICCFDRVL